MTKQHDVAGTVGIALATASFVGIFLMPSITPYETLNCSPYNGGTQCIGNLNFAYPIVLVIGVIGIGLAFYGLFGIDYVLSPIFVFGIVSLGWGLVGLILNYTGFQWCGSGKMGVPFCMAFAYQFFEPYVLVGTLLLGGNVFFWRKREHGDLKDELFMSRSFGAMFASVGIILTFFSYLSIFTRYSNNSGLLGIYWIELGGGVFLLIFGFALLIWSKNRVKKTVFPPSSEQQPEV